MLSISGCTPSVDRYRLISSKSKVNNFSLLYSSVDEAEGFSFWLLLIVDVPC